MADDNENRKTYTIGAFDLPTAEKYVRFLNKHTSFGGHTGLPKEMRNKNPNHSLDFSLGIYQTVDVYAIPPNKCYIGDVVNFYKDNTMNPEGITYVYPCENTDAPMGYMISNTSADVVGICLVHGVIEVPLVYPKNSSYSDVVKKDYVQYDIERGAFDFADSGYPVFNVYQDVDGDWIAIILFGNDNKEGAVYDGPFATTIAGVTGSTMYVNVAEGDIVDKHYRYTCPEIVYGDEDLTDDICLNTGETLWLGVYDTEVLSLGFGSTCTFFVSSDVPVDLTGGTSFYRIAENDNGKLRQLQYGDVVIDYTVSGSTGGGGGVVQDLYSTLKFIEGTTVSSPAICISDSSDYVNIIGGTNTYVTLGSHGEIIVSSTCSYIPTYQSLSASVSGTTATMGITNGAGFSLIPEGTVYVRSGEDGALIVGATVSGGTSSSFDYTGSFKVYCWDTEDEGVVHNIRIYDSNNRDDMVGYAGWVHIGNQKYHVPEYNNTFSDGDVIYLIGTFNEYNELSFEFRKIQTFFPTINDNQFCVRICYATNGKMYQTQYGDIVQPARLVGDGETVEIHSNTISAIGGGGGDTVQSLYSAIKGGTPAICITGSTAYVPIAGGINTYTERDSSGAIVVGCTASGGGGGSGSIEKNIITSGNIRILDSNSDNIVFFPALNNDYSLEDLSVVAAVEAVVGHGISTYLSQYGSDDIGDIILILPENAQPFATVRVEVSPYCASVLLITTDGKPIIDGSGNAQGRSGSVCDTHISEGYTFTYVYVNSTVISQWPSTFYDPINGSYIKAAANQGGCWVILHVN